FQLISRLFGVGGAAAPSHWQWSSKPCVTRPVLSTRAVCTSCPVTLNTLPPPVIRPGQTQARQTASANTQKTVNSRAAFVTEKVFVIAFSELSYLSARLSETRLESSLGEENLAHPPRDHSFAFQLASNAGQPTNV